MDKFDNKYFYIANADGAAFFLKAINSMKNVSKNLNSFPKFSGVCPNITKCEIEGIGDLKSVKVELCSKKRVNYATECTSHITKNTKKKRRFVTPYKYLQSYKTFSV